MYAYLGICFAISTKVNMGIFPNFLQAVCLAFVLLGEKMRVFCISSMTAAAAREAHWSCRWEDGVRRHCVPGCCAWTGGVTVRACLSLVSPCASASEGFPCKMKRDKLIFFFLNKTPNTDQEAVIQCGTDWKQGVGWRPQSCGSISRPLLGRRVFEVTLGCPHRC